MDKRFIGCITYPPANAPKNKSKSFSTCPKIVADATIIIDKLINNHNFEIKDSTSLGNCNRELIKFGRKL